MPTLSRLVSLCFVILLSGACEEGKPKSHQGYAEACKNGCREGSAGASVGSSVARGSLGDPPSGSDDDDSDEPEFDEPFTGLAGSGGIFGGSAGSAAVGGGGFAGVTAPPFGGTSSSGPTGGFGPEAGFGF